MFDRLISWIATTKYYYAAIASVILVVLLMLILAVGSCGRDRTKEKQVEQSAASANAASDAGANAVQVAASVAAKEATADEATRVTVREIEGAETADDIRSAVIDRLCKQPSHRLDPACRVR